MTGQPRLAEVDRKVAGAVLEQPKAILIAGPTASGKSALALRLARERDGAIINADSMQVYRELRVLTARPGPDEEAAVPHRLYGHVPAAEAYSAGRFVAEVEEVLRSVRAEGLLPIIIGGTGLYFKALLEGLSPIPKIPAGVRDYWRAEAVRLGAAGLHSILERRDPEMATRLMSTDSQRITRALEVLDATGRSLASWQREPGVPVIDGATAERIVVTIGRDELYRRCDQRFEAMMAGGALDEVRALAAQGLPEDLPAMRALGVRPLLQLLRGELTREGAIKAAQTETRQYVKRQLTWLNSNMKSWSAHITQ